MSLEGKQDLILKLHGPTSVIGFTMGSKVWDWSMGDQFIPIEFSDSDN